MKPMLSSFFPEEVRPYEWWGWTDNDLLLGDLGRTIGDLLLREDVHLLSSLVNKSHGPLTILRASATDELLASDRVRGMMRKALSSPTYAGCRFSSKIFLK